MLWHLRSLADTLTDARDGCQTTRDWAEKLLRHAAREPGPGVILNLPAHARCDSVSDRAAESQPERRYVAL